MNQPIKYYPVNHGGIRPIDHPRLGVRINGQTAIKYLRFFQHVRVEKLELGKVLARWVPSIPAHPAHLVISVLDHRGRFWRTVKEVELPEDPEISGKAFLQKINIDELNARFAKIMEKLPYVIDMAGLSTDHLRVECDREHPVWPSHGECNGGVFNVPFSILDPLEVFGKPEGACLKPKYNPVLKVGGIKPASPKGMKVYDRPDMLLFEGKHLSVGFSLRRPMLMHLGFDAYNQGKAGRDRLLVTNAPHGFVNSCGFSGPMLRTLSSSDFNAGQWTGEVRVENNRIIYSNLSAIEEIKVDAVFTVEADRILLELTQHCSTDIPAIEFAAWQLAWDVRKGITGAAAMPTLKPGRNGDVKLPMLWATDGVGCLSCRVLKGEDPSLQIESYRTVNAVSGGLSFGRRPGTDECRVLPRGTYAAVFEFGVTSIGPVRKKKSSKLWPGIRTRWSAPFACFRPEKGGFSCHSVSTNDHNHQAVTMDVVTFTEKHPLGPDPMDLARFTVGRALLDGSGYGYCRSLYLDTDPCLISAAGRMHQTSPDLGWLKHIQPGLIESVCRMLSTMGNDGLVVCRDLSGNSGSYRWSSNIMDVIGFGHLDAYVNAFSYRAFRNAEALLISLRQADLAERCREAAQSIRSGYVGAFLNPQTDWIAGWRSRDGRLHDYAFTWVNGPAIAFGLLGESEGRKALLELEKLREKIGVGSARQGLPLNLLPINPEDHMLPKKQADHSSTFETYTDGALSHHACYYLRALSILGLREQARKLARELDEAYAYGIFNGGNFSGNEFRSWEGIPNGYEGTLIANFGTLYAIAVEAGVVAPPNPEWWPAV